MSALLSPLRFLPIEPAQLSLATVLRCGQTFLWRKSAARATISSPVDVKNGSSLQEEWSYGHIDRTIVLRQDAHGIHYRSLFPPTASSAHAEDVLSDTTLSFLRRYFVLDVSLPPLYEFWSARDANFAKKTSNGSRFAGIRILRQPTWECLIEFICSSNNHISRIEGMLRRLCKLYGKQLPSASSAFSGPFSEPNEEDDNVYAFPKPQDLLGDGVTAALRAAGFGYRDAYVTKTAALVCTMAQEAGRSDAEEWLETTSLLMEDDARARLLQFAGVGPKVADCILLFGLGFENVVPVDTHVYQIAVRDYGLKGSRDATVSKAMYQKIRERLQSAWAVKAGWAHQILFTADLASFATYDDPLLVTSTVVVQKESSIKPEQCLSVMDIKIEQDNLQTPSPAKRKRPSLPRTSSRKKRDISPDSLNATALAVAAAAYPSPPQTPASCNSSIQLDAATPTESGASTYTSPAMNSRRSSSRLLSRTLK